MTLVVFQPQAGVVLDDTATAAEGRWVDCDKVRFQRGRPQLVGGWESVTLDTLTGVCRAIHAWADNAGNPLIAFGTHSKLQAYSGGGLYDITPTARLSAVLTGPFSTVSGSALVSVVHAGHGAAAGDSVTYSGASAVGGLTLNGTFSITSITDANTYVITASGNASSTASGGGTVTAVYAWTVGLIDGTGGAGYGTGTFGTGLYGANNYIAEYWPRTWTLDHWGQNLLAAPRNGRIYEWSLNTGTPAAAVANAPARVGGIFVTPERILVATGSNDVTGTWNPMMIRWSDQEINTSWTPTALNQAGDYVLSAGSRIVRGMVGRGANLVFTDQALYRMKYLGDPLLVFGFDLIENNCGLVGPNAVAQQSGIAVWMGMGGQFWMYDGGSVKPIECPVQKYISDNVAWVQQDKIVISTISNSNEFIIFWPDARDGNEISRYALFNYIENTWSIGLWDRTAWTDAGPQTYPVATTSAGRIYYHEKGRSADGAALSWSLESAAHDIADGEQLTAILRVVPDFEEMVGGAAVTINTKAWPQSDPVERSLGTVNGTTGKLDCRLTARQIALKLSGSSAPAFWRLGAIRLDTRESGSKR